MMLLEESGDTAKLEQYIRKFANIGDPDLRRLVADYRYRQGMVISAAQISPDEKRCYGGYGRPEMGVGVIYRYRDGDKGTSLLHALSSGVQLGIPVDRGGKWNFYVSSLFLDSGSPSSPPEMGSFFNSFPPLSRHYRKIDDTVLALDWLAGFTQETESLLWHVDVSTTPLGGSVSPLPLFNLRLEGMDWKIGVYQRAVTESILSWVGQKDPWSDKEWGRVVRTGIGGEKTFEINRQWWWSASVGYSYFYGKNTEDNHSVSLSMSTGRSDEWNMFKRSFGLFVSGEGFSRNSNFYTYGHGGYYSPSIFIVTGPFFRLTSRPCEEFWVDMSFAGGYSFRKTDDASAYKKMDYEGIGYNSSPAWQEYNKDYKGDSENQFTVDAQISGMYHIGGSWFAGGRMGVNNSSDFTEVTTGVFLRYRFGGGGALGKPESTVNEMSFFVEK
jgi:hypothetical protein